MYMRSKYVALILISAVPYLFYLDGEFVFDDFEAIINNRDLNLSTPLREIFQHDFWGTEINSSSSHKSYRPLTILSFRLNREFDNDKLIAKNFKITNLLIHLATNLAVFTFLNVIYSIDGCDNNSGLSIWRDEPFLASVLFAVHPIHVEAVSGIVGRADIISAFFFFISFIAYSKCIDENGPKLKMKCWYFIFSIISATASMLCKETGITVLAICGIYDFLKTIYDDKYSSKTKRFAQFTNYTFIFRQLMLIVALASLLYVRLYIMDFQKPHFQDADNPAAFTESHFSRVATYNYIYFLNLFIMIWPQWLCFDWSMGCVSIINAFDDGRLLFVLLFWAIISVIVWNILVRPYNELNKRYFVMISSVLIIPFLPASNIIMPVGFVIAERILYVPSVGFSALIIRGFSKLMNKSNQKYQKLYRMLFIMFITIMAMKCVQRSKDWTTEERLYNSGLSVCPNNAKVHYNIAKNAGDLLKIDVAESEYKQAIELNPKYYQAMNNLANLLKDQQRYTEAKILLEDALSIKLDFPAAWMNLGIVLANMKEHERSETAYLNALRYRRKYPDCYYNLGNLYLEQNEHEKALVSWFEATKLNPKHQHSWSNILALLDNTGQVERALKLAPMVLSELPHVPAVHFNIANIFGKNGDFVKAEDHFIRAIKLREQNPSAIYYANLGVLYHRWKKPNDAIEMYKKALQVDPNLKSAKNNLLKIRNHL